MKNLRTTCIVLFGALLTVAGSISLWAQTSQQTGDQSQSDSSTAAKDKKKKPADAPAAAATAPAKSTNTAPAVTLAAPAAPATAAAPKPPTVQQVPPADHSGMVWVNTASGVYHKPATHWYGKTKQGKYMTEADAKKAGYRPAKE